ncbi:MAG TPA: glutathione peroxidase [Chitinophagaceae bacterium]|nr:glutathione peroxidase [Chitinophagaceae bacterium]
MRKLVIISSVLIVAIIIYTTISTWNMEMTFRQKLLRSVYPVFTALGRLTGAHAETRINEHKAKPGTPVFDIPVIMNDGSVKKLSEFAGKKIMIVNTASDCGYTRQFDDLQKLYEQESGKLVIIGFPSNDFKEQEKGSDAEIEAYCRRNYGVTFPLAQKSKVSKGEGQHAIYQWLSSKEKNGWNSKSPSWNFSKYLINEQGVLTHYFDPAVDPVGKEILKAIQL